ncbi:MAG: hypothetical protein QOJ46_1553 [bacterium]|jgi:hypothetical protein
MITAPRRSRRWRYAILAAAGVALAGATAGAAMTLAAPGISAAASKRCFGAAARDPDRACGNLTRSAVPGLDVPERGSPCKPVPSKLDTLCAFGVAPSKAVRHIALLGDSHAMNWRAAVDAVARDRRWRAYSISLPGCVFSEAVAELPEGRRESCTQWYRSVRAWFARHPEISVVFVSHNASAPIVPGPGERYSDVMLAGWTRAWTALPSSIKKIIVLRDAPDPADDTLRCLRRVLADGKQRPGPACATARAEAVRWDSAVSAADNLHAKRYRFVDLTSFFCGRRSCYPVVGGVRVYDDVLGHFTTAFSRTLGPYLLREVRRLIATW